MRRRRAAALALAAVVLAAPAGGRAARAADGGCPRTTVAERAVRDLGKVEVWRSADAYGFTTHLHVNADGAPNAYTPANDGLSFLCDGAVARVDGACVYPTAATASTWQPLCREAWRLALAENFEGPRRLCVFGMLTDAKGRPLRQKAGDPLPGAFISATALHIDAAPAGTQRRYVDSTAIPFFVLPNSLAVSIGAELGDVAVVRRRGTGALAAAVFADTGPTWGLGEGSIALHRALGNEPVRPYRGGAPRAKFGISGREVTFLVFPGSAVATDPDPARWRDAIARAGEAALERWGGADRLAACAG